MCTHLALSISAHCCSFSICANIVVGWLLLSTHFCSRYFDVHLNCKPNTILFFKKKRKPLDLRCIHQHSLSVRRLVFTLTRTHMQGSTMVDVMENYKIYPFVLYYRANQSYSIGLSAFDLYLMMNFIYRKSKLNCCEMNHSNSKMGIQFSFIHFYTEFEVTTSDIALISVKRHQLVCHTQSDCCLIIKFIL